MDLLNCAKIWLVFIFINFKFLGLNDGKLYNCILASSNVPVI